MARKIIALEKTLLKPKLKNGDIFGEWKLESQLGRGGNGEVWSVKRTDNPNDIAAIKILSKAKPAAIKRFRAEVEVLRTHNDIRGLLPVIGHNLPEAPTAASPAWYVMQRAEPLIKALPRIPKVIIQQVAKVAHTLATLHERGVSHRDVKPDNLLLLNGEPFVSDFGLADFPNKPEITGKGERLGPRWTIAPEMERSPTTADGRLADVYSLAKTLWILLANDIRCFEGRYHSDDLAVALKNYLPTANLLHMLDGLLFQATANNPTERPTMGQFTSTLMNWLEREKQFEYVSLGDWRHVQQKIFPHGIPTRVSWEYKPAIIAILNVLGATAAHNHTFAPNCGGLDIVGASDSFEADCIELRFEAGIKVIVKPTRLMFESFPGNDDWAYFILETKALAPITGTENPYYEEMVELSPAQYIERHWWEAGYYELGDQQVQLPSEARVVSRHLKGSFLIVAKASDYNKHNDYNGTHDRFTSDEFRKMMENMIRKRPEAFL